MATAWNILFPRRLTEDALCTEHIRHTTEVYSALGKWGKLRHHHHYHCLHRYDTSALHEIFASTNFIIYFFLKIICPHVGMRMYSYVQSLVWHHYLWTSHPTVQNGGCLLTKKSFNKRYVKYKSQVISWRHCTSQPQLSAKFIHAATCEILSATRRKAGQCVPILFSTILLTRLI